MTSADPIPDIRPGTRILIAGASGGLGRAVVEALTATEAIVGAHYFTGEDRLRETLEEAGLANRSRMFQADLSDPEEGSRLVSSFVAWAEGLDVLIQLSGGISEPVSWRDISPAQWQADLQLNLTVPFFLARTAMGCMDRGGKVILTSTASAQHGGGGTSMAYGAAKAGIECVTKGLARAGAPDGILVNAVCPGFIDTSFHALRMKRSEGDLEKRAALVPLGRAGHPAEVAATIVFLASPSADYITGQCISVSGGDWL